MKYMQASILTAAFIMLPAVSAEVEVTANPDYTFSPKLVTVQPGDTVHFTNLGGYHNVEADDKSFRCAESCDDQGGNGDPSSTHWSFTRAFDKPGEIRYYCDVHGAPGGLGMSGMIIVAPQAYDAALRGPAQIPAVITRASGSLHADISKDRSSLAYRLQIEGMDSAPLAVALHIGQVGTNGGVVAVLCGEGSGKSCPASGEMPGALTSADVRGVPAQGIEPGDVGALLRALSEGSVYVSVSSQHFPAGELRGQLAPAQR